MWLNTHLQQEERGILKTETNKKIAVAMSGGIDSSYVALKYKEQGFDVIAVTGMMTNDESSKQVVQNAKDVCDFLKIEHHVLDMSDDFEENVINYFKESYKNGLTPNPCVVCNRKIKWGRLRNYAINELGADFFATGHYARCINQNGTYKICRAKDEKKDQLYVLFSLSQKDLSQTLFPMGEVDKEDAKRVCLEKNLPCKNSKESQDVCFIAHPDTTKKFLSRELGEQKGKFVDIRTSKVLGEHNGFYFFTTGQRKGIGLSAPQPLYVVDIDSEKNIVYVGYKEDLYSSSLVVDKINFQLPGYENSEFHAMVKIRYNTSAKPAVVKSCADCAEIFFDEPVSGVTPGQAAVIYDESKSFLIGGGWICKKIK